MENIERDVVIIGAGPAGLMAARELSTRGHSIAVLEARDRVGGRTWTNDIEGAPLEIGGQWVSPDQTALLALLDELGLETYPRYREGNSVFIAEDGTRTEYIGETFPTDEDTAREMDRLIAELDALASHMDPARPWEHPQARELDTISFRSWLRSISENEAACTNIGLFIAGGMLTKPDHAFSVLQAVLMAASAGSFSNLVDEDFILDRRVIGGMQSVSTRLAADIGAGNIYLNNPVLRLEWKNDGVQAVGADVTVRAKRVIVAVPPNLYSRISYVPALPRLQHQMHQHQSMGLVIKVHAVYPTPFWRNNGLSGTGFSPSQLVQEVYDNTMHGDERGTLVGFVSDEKADAMFALSAEERQTAILASIANYLGDEALTPDVYYESDWGSEEWTRGAYATSYDLGGLHRYGAHQHDSVGPIFWCSSDLAGEGYQHVDGAIRMGSTVAQRIHSQLS